MINNNILITLVSYDTSEQQYYNKSIISFAFEKDNYCPYSTFSACLLVDNINNDFCEIRLSIDDIYIHHGTVDHFTVKDTPYGKIATVFSNSFGMALLRNELPEGIIYQANFDKLLYNNKFHIPYVTNFEDCNPVNYIYIKEHQNLWDAIVMTSIKSCNKFPFLSYPNNIAWGPLYDYSITFDKSKDIIELGYLQNYDNLYSTIRMRDSNGNYDYLKANCYFAITRMISRSKYINYDTQWLEKEDHGLSTKIAYSMRGIKGVYIVYKGFHNIDIMHKFIVNTSELHIAETSISNISIKGNKNGIFTKLTGYYDLYANTEQFNKNYP